MGYERYPRGTNPQGDYYNREETQDYGRDYGSGRQYSYSSARDYQSAGMMGRDDDRDDRGGRDRDGSGSYGQREYGNAGYARDYNRDRDDRGYSRSDDGRSSYGSNYGGSDYGRSNYGQSNYGQSNDGRSSYGQSDYGQSRQYGQSGQYGASGSNEYHGSYGSDGRRFVDVGNRKHWDDDNDRNRSYGRGEQTRYGGNDRGDSQRGGNYGRAPQGYDYQDRGFFARAGDEVRSWFGDEDAERRREMDNRYDEREYNQRDRHDRDSDYHHWRSGQIAALDRDYDEYRSENRTKFQNEFSSWRTNRQTQRDALDKVKEHAEVVGSDGSHVGTVDKVRGDRILLTKNDVDAGGQHHSIPSSWIQSVEDKKVTLSKTADEAKKQWRDEENKQAMFGYGDRTSENTAGQRSQSTATGYGSGESTSGMSTGTTGASSSATGTGSTDTNLNSSFSGTYQNK
ncbi:DUF2171 domain-containing protein [Sphingomonas sp. RHCKR47]|uniref:DUF2171 domain-containing protein n=1 Tax=Sphingomonas citricola TaxID=2862498 RepID=UPI001CA5AA9B|nr:DUF2171 domain-containing protein [Sphingomonas citricola]MBW6522914.1 DUF2171 domain-containing protein [Sphingomonas citricola]